MNPANLEVIGLAYSIDHYVDGICGNIWEVYTIPDGGLSPELEESALKARDFTDGNVIGIIFPCEGMIDYKGPHDSDHDASEDAGWENKILAKKMGLRDLGEICSIYS